ncbi:D-amino acid dehydrogenase [Advenella alkanexedens]|uniref:D-amino acid dehydrogenase n=1 Tax=Advenella alkanexedens TaxID=1481665 RepID=UPI002676F51F|nr:D-amino acid dehydrogenase [Advenella alkanexedens]WKU19708.1 D-amino acid dehydrogenase [Advenella alkanexedens]
MSKITIIGAGITGITTAYTLNKLGYEVTVIDKNRNPAMETSFANGCQLSACNAEVWNSKATLLKGLRWIGKRNAPLLLNPSISWHKYSWLIAFVRNIPNHERNSIEATRLSIEARAHLFEMAEEENIQFDLERRGILHIYYNKKSFEKALESNRLLQQGGLERYPVTEAEARAIEPALTSSLYAGLYTPSDSTGDIHKFTTGLAKACARRGVQFEMDSIVKGIRRDHSSGSYLLSIDHYDGSHQKTIETEKIVVCAGNGSRKIAKMLGDNINLYPVKGYSISVPLEDQQSQVAAPKVSLLDEDSKIVSSYLSDRLRVAGTAEFNGYNKDIRADRIQPLIDWTRKLFPEISTRNVIPWCGLRPMTPSMMPHVCAGSKEGVFYNTGHGHLGWTLAPVTAHIVSRLLEPKLN